MRRKRTPLVVRFISKVDFTGGPDGCWNWTGATSGHGYGHIRSGGRGEPELSAHRASYEMLVGPIPEGLHLDHLCRNRACVNPAHLEPVTCAENIRRGETGANERRKTHCPQGHPYSGANLHITPQGYRRCRACNREKSRRLRARRKAAAAAK